MRENMLFISVILRVWSTGSYLLTISDAASIHSAIFVKISTQNTGIAQTLHNKWQLKDFTISIVKATEGEGWIRMTFIGQEGMKFLELLSNELSEHPLLIIGKVEFFCDLPSIDTTSSPWSKVATWDDLTAPISSLPAPIGVVFITPTVIMKQSKSGHRISHLFPDPESVFRGLAKKWKGFGGPNLPTDFRDYLSSGKVYVSDFNISTIDFETPERTQKGFTGFVRYGCQPSELDYMRFLIWLLRLGRFTGVGYQTARGMGAIDIPSHE